MRLDAEGIELLRVMSDLHLTLDVSHMTDQSIHASLDAYEGVVIASHANARALLKGMNSERHLTDNAIRKLVEREAVIGVVPFNRFLDANWVDGNPREQVKLEKLITQIDHICQIAGDCLHVGIGSDFDGGFGFPRIPLEMDTIADLQKLAPMLIERGYNEKDIELVFNGNWQRKLGEILS
jgi:membrane dipeptidase